MLAFALNVPQVAKANESDAGELSLLEILPAIVEPRESPYVQVEVKIPNGAELQSVQLFYHVGITGGEQSITMVREDAARMVFGARIPAQSRSNEQMLRFFVRASLQNSESSWSITLPSRQVFKDDDFGQLILENGKPINAGESYLGYVIRSRSGGVDTPETIPTIDLFVKDLNLALTDAGTTGAMRMGGEFYDGIRVSIHGMTTTGKKFLKKSFNIDMPNDHRLKFHADSKRAKDFNLLTNYADRSKVRNTVGYSIYRTAGTPAPQAFVVRVNVNGSFYGMFDFVEEADDQFLQGSILDKDGALYKMYSGENFSSGSNAKKKNRSKEDNSDLIGLDQALKGSHEQVQTYLYDNMDMAALVNYLAAMTISGNTDCCHKNFYLYRDSDDTLLWQILPWDQDLSLGRVYTKAERYFSEDLYTKTPLFVGQNNNVLIKWLYSDQRFVDMVTRRIRTLAERFLEGGLLAQEIRKLRDNQEFRNLASADQRRWGSWGAQPNWTDQINLILNEYLPKRQDYLLRKLVESQSPSLPGAQPREPEVSLAEVEVSPLQKERIGYIRLYNDTSTAIDVSDWQIKGSLNYTLRPGTVIPANSSYYLVQDVQSFLGRTAQPKGGRRLIIQGDIKGNWPVAGRVTLLQGDRIVSESSW